jgi:hypothetical protein
VDMNGQPRAPSALPHGHYSGRVVLVAVTTKRATRVPAATLHVSVHFVLVSIRQNCLLGLNCGYFRFRSTCSDIHACIRLLNKYSFWRRSDVSVGPNLLTLIWSIRTELGVWTSHCAAAWTCCLKDSDSKLLKTSVKLYQTRRHHSSGLFFAH